MVEIFTGKYSEYDKQELDLSGTYKAKDGASYEYCVEVHTEDKFIRVKDSIGRMVPVDFDHLDNLIDALTLAHLYISKAELPRQTTVGEVCEFYKD